MKDLTDQSHEYITLWDGRLAKLLLYLIVAIMIVCVSVSLVLLGRLFLPGWSGVYLIVLSFFIALEAMYSQQAIRQYSFPETEWWLYRITEWVIILLALKGLSYLGETGNSFWADLPAWQQNFRDAFFTPEYLFSVGIVVVLWGLSSRFAEGIFLLEVDVQTLRKEEESGIFEYRTDIRNDLIMLILGIGSGMIFIFALLRLDLLAAWFAFPTLRASAYNLLVYFLLSLVFLSMTQFSILRVNWILQRIPIRRDVTGRWFLYSFLFILALTLVARFLPTQYTLGFLTTLNYLLGILLALLNLLVTLLLLPFIYLLGWLMSLFGIEQADRPSMAMPEFEPPPPPPVDGGQPPWVELLKAVLFWVVFLGVIGFSLGYYLRERSHLLERLRSLPFGATLARFWVWVRDWVMGVNQRVSTAVENSLDRWRARRERLSAEQPWRFVNLRNLSPRQRVRFYYLAMVRRGTEQGFVREASQTPYEYSQFLAESLEQAVDTDTVPQDEISPNTDPDDPQTVDGDISALTERFMEARYSLHEVTAQDASRVKRHWEQIRRVLRRPFHLLNQGSPDVEED